MPLPTPVLPSSSKRRIIVVTSLGLAGLLAGLLSGCSTSATSAAPDAFANVAGNWQFSSATTAASLATTVAGNLTVSGADISGTLHPISGTCSSPSNIPVAGSISTSGKLTLSSVGLPGAAAALSVSGTLSADGRSLSGISFAFTGLPCAHPAAHTSAPAPRLNPTPAIAQQYLPIIGTYTGTFNGNDGTALPVSATLTQTTTADQNGMFHLTGNATFSNNPCLNTPVVTDSVVTGSTVAATYTDTRTNNSVSATGTFSDDATSLTISNWTLSGNCGAETGTGLLTKR